MPHAYINTCTHSHTERERQEGQKFSGICFFFNVIKLVLVKEAGKDLLEQKNLYAKPLSLAAAGHFRGIK